MAWCAPGSRAAPAPADALAYAERAIAQRGIATAFPPDDRESRRRTAWGTLEVSLEQLGADERARFAELAVFVEDAEIPTSVAIGLWRQTAALDPLDGEDLLARLAELSLLSELDLGRGVLRLHDVVRTLLREGPVKERLAELDRLLVAHFREASDGSLAGLSDVYGLRHLIAHLSGAGEIDAARALLADPAWLSNKLQRLGIQPLLADYAALSHRDAALDLIRAALTLAAPALARNPRELAPQLLARLAPGDAAGLDEFLTRTQRLLSPPTLVPSRPTFTPPGAELRRFEGHEDGVTSVTVLADGRRALSGSDDRTLRLWDLETGAELRRFEGHERPGHQRDGAGRRAARALGVRRPDAAAVGSRDRRRAGAPYLRCRHYGSRVVARARHCRRCPWTRARRRANRVIAVAFFSAVLQNRKETAQVSGVLHRHQESSADDGCENFVGVLVWSTSANQCHGAFGGSSGTHRGLVLGLGRYRR